MIQKNKDVLIDDSSLDLSSEVPGISLDFFYGHEKTKEMILRT